MPLEHGQGALHDGNNAAAGGGLGRSYHNAALGRIYHIPLDGDSTALLVKVAPFQADRKSVV